MKRPLLITIIVITAVFMCCCVSIGLGGGLFGLFNSAGEFPSSPPIPIKQEDSTGPVPPSAQDFIIEPFEPTNTRVRQTAEGMQAELQNIEIPISNLYDLAARLQGKKDIPLTVPAPLIPLEIGEKDSFWVTNTDSNGSSKIDAQLQYITPHLYFWVEDGVEFDQKELKDLCEAFESVIYPTNREFFGSEWSPGVDNDPHLYILLSSNLGNDLAGYFSSSDEYNPQVHEFSNAHEMFLMNSDNVDLGDPFTYGVLAHEFQHMIHWYRDINEETWLNEGFSELASLLNNYDVGGFDYAYVANTDLQLTDWGIEVGDNSGHYGASFLFVTYFLDRFGEEATRALVASSENGFKSIDKVLMDLNEIDPRTGKLITANDLFSDWVVTNYVNSVGASDGRFAYRAYTNFATAGWTDSVENCPSELSSSFVYQYGADYIYINCPGEHTLHFLGQQTVKLLQIDPYSGEHAFWSNKGDESNMTLTREFDFTNTTGPLSLTYQTWYDLEQDYDYAYVEVSEDGQNWTLLRSPNGTEEDVSGNSMGWGYNGATNGWIAEYIDIGQYAGKKIQIRFEYITDAAVNGEGFLVDDIRIPEINYYEDFENGSGGWQSAGFVYLYNMLPQTYRLNLIIFKNDGSISITPIDLDENMKAEIPISLVDGEYATLTVSGTTGFTRQPAAYQYEIK